MQRQPYCNSAALTGPSSGKPRSRATSDGEPHRGVTKGGKDIDDFESTESYERERRAREHTGFSYQPEADKTTQIDAS